MSGIKEVLRGATKLAHCEMKPKFYVHSTYVVQGDNVALDEVAQGMVAECLYW